MAEFNGLEKRGRGRPRKSHQKGRKHEYHGRWTESTGFLTLPGGERVEMTFDEYVEWVKENRGLYEAHRIKMRHKSRIEERERRAEHERLAREAAHSMPDIVSYDQQGSGNKLFDDNRKNFVSGLLNN